MKNDDNFAVRSTMYYNLIGGVMSINRENYHRANGFSNVYWGWGSEDDDFSARYHLIGVVRIDPLRFMAGCRTLFYYVVFVFSPALHESFPTSVFPICAESAVKHQLTN